MSKFAVLLLLAVLVGPAVPQAQVSRFVYVTPIDGSGTDDDPYRSRCLSERLAGRGNIDLTPYGINRFLCTSTVLPADMTGVQQLGNSLSAKLTPARKAALEQLLGRSLQSDIVLDVIVDIVKPRLKRGRDGKLRVFLGDRDPIYQKTAWVPFEDGGIVADIANFAASIAAPSIAWAASLSESWNCSDSSAITCDLTWTEFTGSGWSIVSNQASGTANNAASESRAETSLTTTNHQATVTIVSFTLGSSIDSHCGPIVRKDTTATRDYYIHYARKKTAGDTNSHELGKRIAGVSTALDSDLTDTFDGEVITSRVDGDSVSGDSNGSLIVGPITDTSILESSSGNSYTGIRIGTTSGSSTCVLDGFSAEDVDTSSSFGPLRRRAS